MLCWKCKESMQGLVCVSCSAIRPPPPKADYFAVFGLQKRYFIDSEAVRSAHLRLAKILHPDKWRQASAVERRMSKQWMALVNEGLRVLENDILRARYLATKSTTISKIKMNKLLSHLAKLFFLYHLSKKLRFDFVPRTLSK